VAKEGVVPDGERMGVGREQKGWYQVASEWEMGGSRRVGQDGSQVSVCGGVVVV
jgi:hypothetical protein